jgi:opacity protein-like surface antigen
MCIAVETAVVAQCDCGSCGSSTGGEVYDAGVSSFLHNLGTAPLNTEPGCVDNCCERPSCPAVCCGPYVSAFGGWSNVSEFFRTQDLGTISRPSTTQATDNMGNPLFDMMGNPIFVSESVQQTQERQFNFQDGFAGGIAIGRQVHQRARAELEFSYRSPDFDSYQVQTFTDNFLETDSISAATGSLEVYSLMANFLFDISPRTYQRFNFYGGAGVGIVSFSGQATTATNTYDIDDTGFEFQLIGGVNRTITSRVDIFGEYRYVVADNVNVFDVTAGQSLGDFDYKANEVFFGIRIRK